MSIFEPFEAEPTCAGACTLFRDGHRLHPVQHRLAFCSPWAWRSALVLWVFGNEALLTYWGTNRAFSVWHHEPLDQLLSEGQDVEVNENLRVLRAADAWSVQVEGGLGPVDTPDDLQGWADRVGHSVVDPRTGRTVTPLTACDG